LIWVVYGKLCYLYFFDRKNNQIFSKIQSGYGIKRKRETDGTLNKENDGGQKD